MSISESRYVNEVVNKAIFDFGFDVSGFGKLIFTNPEPNVQYEYLKRLDTSKLSKKEKEQYAEYMKQFGKEEIDYMNKVRDAYLQMGITGLGLWKGLPAVEMQRIQQSINDEQFNTAQKKAMRIYGLPKDAISYWAPTPKEAHDDRIKVGIQDFDVKSLTDLFKDSMSWEDQIEGDRVRKSIKSKLRGEVKHRQTLMIINELEKNDK